jgi:hypothetical protein
MTCIVILEVTAKKGTGMQLVENLRALLILTMPTTSSWWSAGQRANTTRTTSPGGSSVATLTS